MRKNNRYAAETIPIRLLISIVLISTILLLMGIGYKNFVVSLAQHQIEGECRDLLSQLQTMVISGVARNIDEINAADGSTRIYTFQLPTNLRYLAFGVDPDPSNTGSLQTGLTEDGSLLCYQIEGGSKQVMWLPKDQFRFRKGEYRNGTWNILGAGEGFVVARTGKTTVQFELIQYKADQYILIQYVEQ